MHTRIAPTPSGFLHAGNLLNFLLVHRVAAAEGANITLRIDDLDVFRMRDEYVEDIFRCLAWLGISWQFGPQSMHEYLVLPTPEERSDHYYEALTLMVENGLPAFVCRCSRRDLGRDARCEAGCVEAGLKLTSGKTAIRIRVPDSEASIKQSMGDFVIWRREDLPAYQLASLVDDHESRITHIVRGSDLLDSTHAQRWLAKFLPESPFLQARIMHHALLMSDQGQKLSKSQGTERLVLTEELREHLLSVAESTPLE